MVRRARIVRFVAVFVLVARILEVGLAREAPPKGAVAQVVDAPVQDGGRACIDKTPTRGIFDCSKQQPCNAQRTRERSMSASGHTGRRTPEAAAPAHCPSQHTLLHLLQELQGDKRRHRQKRLRFRACRQLREQTSTQTQRSLRGAYQ